MIQKKGRLEQGLKCLELMDANINILSVWITNVEQFLNKNKDIHLDENVLKDQIKFIKVNFHCCILFIELKY